MLRRKAGLSLAEIREALGVRRSLLAVVLLPVVIHERASQVAERTGHSIWDATIMASALDAGCDKMVGEDMQERREFDGLVIRNPFGPAVA